jgi:vacuolar-type H+-ATPase subunit E/Vma4
MSLETILEAIRIAGQEQVNRVELAAQTQVIEILDKANEEADQIREQASDEATAPGYRERSRILHKARMVALQIIGDARQDFIDAALEQTRIRLASIYTEASYPAVLRKLTREAFDELEGSLSDIHKATVEVDHRDLELMKSILAEMGMDVPVSTDLTSWGGLIVKSEAAKVVVINTLEARLASATPYLRRSLAALFENQECLLSTMETLVCEQ